MGSAYFVLADHAGLLTSKVCIIPGVDDQPRKRYFTPTPLLSPLRLASLLGIPNYARVPHFLNGKGFNDGSRHKHIAF